MKEVSKQDLERVGYYKIDSESVKINVLGDDGQDRCLAVKIDVLDAAAEWAILRAGTGEAGHIMLANNHRLEIGGNSMISRTASAEAFPTLATATW